MAHPHCNKTLVMIRSTAGISVGVLSLIHPLQMITIREYVRNFSCPFIGLTLTSLQLHGLICL